MVASTMNVVKAERSRLGFMLVFRQSVRGRMKIS
jgi:hypothetical protein